METHELDTILCTQVNNDDVDDGVTEFDEEEEMIIETLAELRRTRFDSVRPSVYQFGTDELNDLTQEKIEIPEARESIDHFKVRDKKEHITDYFKPTTKDLTLKESNLNFRDLERVKVYRKEADKQKVFNKAVRSSLLAGKAWGRIQEKKELIQEEAMSRINKKVAEGEWPSIQEGKYLLIGGDVAALYPSLDQTETAYITAKAVQESGLTFSGIDYETMSVYLALTIGIEGMRDWGVGHCYPTKKIDSSSESLSSKSNRDCSSWEYHTYDLNATDRRNMLAAMIHVATLVLMKSSCYTFGGHIFLQQSGAGIGLRASACAAKVVMAVWDICWAKCQKACGLKVNVFMRYIDDIRVYLMSISRGWKWNGSNWEFNSEDNDERDDETRTKDELKKSFESIFSFLGFTTEAQDDYDTEYLPTLDTQTHVDVNGLIFYKHYDKPMASNTTLQRGTALPKSTVFSSLRQDLCRRLLNTSRLECEEVFKQVIEDYTQILINSGHQYSFVKAVVLQGITKYKYMVQRSEKKPTDPKYRPLYRPRIYQRNERLIVKRIQQSTWFKGDDLGDPWRQGWKKKIVHRRNRVDNGNRGRSKKNITSVLFVPATKDSVLFNAVSSAEEKITSDNLSWDIKVVEKGGTPLASVFMTQIPVLDGCPLGSACVVCENDGMRCSKRGVVYKATCQTCKDNNNSPNEGTEYTYIGETSRPVRSRVKEHMDSLNNLNPTSFQVTHWMDVHSMDTTPPSFSFKILESYQDPLSRQLSEAVNIIYSGNLNKKTEFQVNDLYRMVTEQDKYTQQQEAERKKKKREVGV